MIRYKHTQIGYLLLSASFILAIFFIWLYVVIEENIGENLPVIILMGLIAFTLGSFSILHVTIDEKYLGIKFSYGIFRKKFLLKDIVSVKNVKNSWYHGWGIRLSLWPLVWIYNVSGYDAIEITMRNGKAYRIGTDTPEDLELALNRVIGP